MGLKSSKDPGRQEKSFGSFLITKPSIHPSSIKVTHPDRTRHKEYWSQGNR